MRVFFKPVEGGISYQSSHFLILEFFQGNNGNYNIGNTNIVFPIYGVSP